MYVVPFFILPNYLVKKCCLKREKDIFLTQINRHMKLFSILAIIVCCTAACGDVCDKVLKPAQHASGCFEQTIENFKKTGVAIVEFDTKKGKWYLLDRESRHLDGSDYIINEKCDTVCVLCGFCDLSKCQSCFDENAGKTIWHK
jgi:hypothetical protein